MTTASTQPSGETVTPQATPSMAQPPDFTNDWPLLNLPTDFTRPPMPAQEIAAVPFSLSADLVQQLEQLTAADESTLSTILLAAFQVLLYRYTGQDEIAVGVAQMAQASNVRWGMLCTEVNGQGTWRRWLAQVQQAVPMATPLPQGNSPVAHIQAAFLSQATDAPCNPARLPTQKRQIGLHDAMELALLIAQPDGQLAPALLYSADLFTAATAARMAGHFQMLLQGIVANPDQTLATLPLLTITERQQLLVEWNATASVYPADQGIHQLFEEQVIRTPEAIAVVFENEQLTYRELNQRANCLAHYLIQQGVGAEVLVGICVERSVEMVMGLLAILKAGGAYVPLDPTYPQERLAFMLEDTDARILLTQAKLRPNLPTASPILGLDTQWATVTRERQENPSGTGTADNLAYVMYTSGSTGRPKGVSVIHRNVVRLVKNTNFAQLTPEHVFLQLSPIPFDAATLEVWGPLLNGGKLVIMPSHPLSLIELDQAIRQHKVTTLWLTAGLFHIMVDERLEDLRPIRQLLAGGEVLSVPHIQKVLRALPDCQLINGYGPTENTTFTCCYPFPAEGQIGASAPIGRPIANTQVYILDRYRQPVPIGVPGELYAGGDGVARGYHNRPELTRERFLDNPFGEGRLYKTGDLVRYLPDGNIEFLGRIDGQVKIRGFRIELGEIEAALRRQPQVREAVVLAREDRPGQKYLAAYIVPMDGAVLHPEELKYILATQLPGYMVPTAWAILPRLPLTPNGKIDRKALPVPPPSRPTAPVPGVIPQTELEQQIGAAWRAVLQVDTVGLDDNFFDVGGTSLLLARLHSRLVASLDMKLSPVLFYQYPTIRALAAYLSQSTGVAEHAAHPGKPRHQATDIAIIGMSCRFPGASDVETLWQNLCAGVESFIFLADEQLMEHDRALLHQPNYVKVSAVLADIDSFDASFFGYSAKEAEMMDPQQRIFLECAWEALEQAGYAPDAYPGRVGVYAGSGPNTYAFNNVYPAHHFAHGRAFWQPMHDLALTLAHEKDFLPTRLSYKLNLTGPSVNVQTACSTSLVAVHLACQSLRNGECEMALAGGVSISVPQNIGYLHQEGMIFAPDGHTRAFDADAQGTVFGSGAGVVVLKPLDHAQADGDHIYAVIKGSAVNNDGAVKVGYTAPGVAGQANVITAALDAADVDAASITYLEAHGTGTALGDPVEVEALTSAYRQHTQRTGFCAIGTVKSNLGHLMQAAGMPGLMKTALALQHGLLPPTLHFTRPNPRIDFANSPFYVHTQLAAWPANGAPRRAGVSAFGMGGTNAHVILEEAPGLPPGLPQIEAGAASRSERNGCVLTLSAKTRPALQALAQRYADYLQAHPDVALADLCFTANAGRKQFNHRLAFVAQSTEQLRAQLLEAAKNALAGFPQGAGGDCAASEPAFALNSHTPTIAFLFTGQGSQYVDMGRQLYETQPTFRQALNRCDAILRQHLGESLLTILYPEDREGNGQSAIPNLRSAIDETAYTQPALFALEYALAQLWLSWGIQPLVVMGHSVGELVAACVAGVFSLEDGLKLIAARGRLMQALPPTGAMAAVFATEDQVAAALSPYQATIAIAAVNSPENIVISGEQEAVQAICNTLAAAGIKTKTLTVSHAFHSPLMEPMVTEFEAVARTLTFAPPKLKLISNVTGALAGPEITTPTYWRDHIRQPVQFASGMATLHHQGIDTFIEIGPKPTLLGLGQQCIDDRRFPIWLSSLRQGQDDWPTLLNSLAALYTAGAKVDWAGFDRDYVRRRLPLPTYPFQRQRYWIEAGGRPAHDASFDSNEDESMHPLLGRPLHLAAANGEDPAGAQAVRFEARLNPTWPSLAWLADHRVDQTILMPLTGYLDMAWAAGKAVFAVAECGAAAQRHGCSFSVADVFVHQPLVLPADAATTLQVVVKPNAQDGYAFQVFSYVESHAQKGRPHWTLCVSAQLRGAQSMATLPLPLPLSRSNGVQPAQVDLAALRARCPRRIAPADLYAAYHMNYGPTFQIVEQLWKNDAEVVGVIQLPPALTAATTSYHLHPALLDACGQILAALMPPGDYLPMLVERFEIYRRPGRRVCSYARLRPDAAQGDLLTGDVILLDEQGEIVAVWTGISFRRHHQQSLPDWFYAVIWQPQERARSLPQPSADAWLICADQTGVGTALAAALEQVGQRVLMVWPGLAYEQATPILYRLDPREPAHFRQLMHALSLSHNSKTAHQKIINLWGLDESTAQTIESSLGYASGLHLVQALAQTGRPANMWLVTRGAQPVGKPSALQVQQAVLWGLAQVIRLEYPELRCVTLDLDAQADAATAAQSLLQDLLAPDSETQIAYCQGARYAARLQRYEAQTETRLLPPNRPFRVRMAQYGLLENLQLAPLTRRTPGPHEVEIEVRAAGLNFRDVLNVLGMLEGYYSEALGITDAGDVPLGFECAGVISAVGEQVTGLQVGDTAIALADGGLASFVTVPAHNVVRKPAHLSFAEAATIPAAFTTAWYGLHHLAQVKAGDRVLIHAAAGGVGQAAVQLARRAGAEIYGTASPAKWAHLKGGGVAHVLNSRTLAFADEIRALTQGRGVDVILNSLNGEFIDKNVAILARGGRFVELGKIGIWTGEQMRRQRPDAAYFPFDFKEDAEADPSLTPTILAELMTAFAQGELQPLPHTVFPVQEMVSAFRLMQQARHIGKIVLALPPLPADANAATNGAVIRGDGSYLVTGGLGGLGRQVARWLVTQGARHLVLAGRQGAATPEAQTLVGELIQQGVEVVVVRADVSQATEVERLLGQCPQPLRGIFHAAGVLDDGVLEQQSLAKLARVMGPKAVGAWHLHQLSQALPLDCFVCFSSVAALLGSAGQGNYAAASAFLDALAHHRRALGLAALSINWGSWAEVGMAARLSQRDQQRLAAHGIRLIAPEPGVAALGHLLRQNATQALVLAVDWDKWLAQSPTPAPFYAQFTRGQGARGKGQRTGDKEQGAGQPTFRQQLEQAAPGKRRNLLLAHVQEQVGKVLGRGPGGQGLELQLGFFEAGMDSLTSIELRNYLQNSLGCALPATLAFNYPTIDALTEHLAGKVLALDTTAPSEDTRQADRANELAATIEQLSAAEAEDLLRAELEKLAV